MPDFFSDGCRLDKKIIGTVGKALARPGQVDDRVDHHIRKMHALGPRFTGNGAKCAVPQILVALIGDSVAALTDTSDA